LTDNVYLPSELTDNCPLYGGFSDNLYENTKKCVELSLNISVFHDFCGWNLEREKRIIILDDRLLYFLSTAIVILIVIVITIKHQIFKIAYFRKTHFNLSLL
jgi:hypothetical protein